MQIELLGGRFRMRLRIARDAHAKRVAELLPDKSDQIRGVLEVTVLGRRICNSAVRVLYRRGYPGRSINPSLRDRFYRQIDSSTSE